MATPSVKATYALDPETVRSLEGLARRWRVTKSEALRRVVRAASASAPTAKGLETLEVLDRLQRSGGLTSKDATKWSKGLRAERRMTSLHREPR